MVLESADGFSLGLDDSDQPDEDEKQNNVKEEAKSKLWIELDDGFFDIEKENKGFSLLDDDDGKQILGYL